MPISEQALQDVFNLAVHAKHHQGRKKDLRLCFAELEHLTLAQGDDKFSACEGLLNFSQIKAVFISNVCGYTYDEIMNILFSLLIRSGKILEAKFSAEEVGDTPPLNERIHSSGGFL